MTMWLRLGAIALAFAAGNAQAADPTLTGKEYKVLLAPTKFSSNLVTTANSFLSDLRIALRAVNFDRTIDGSFADDKIRTVRYYDSPGTCRLRGLGYNFRERVNNGEREANLKFRSETKSVAASADVSGSSADAETKFEVDITPPFKQVYSHSTSQPLSNSKNLNILDDVEDLFPGTEDLDLPSNEDFKIVSNLTISEYTYDGPESDLGAQTAEFTLTLWYANSSALVSNAEISFKVEDNDGDFTGPVDTRSKLLFDTIRNMTSWVSTSSTTKTDWVYKYQPSFCR